MAALWIIAMSHFLPVDVAIQESISNSHAWVSLEWRNFVITTTF